MESCERACRVRFTSLLPRLWANWITLLGSIITTVSGFAILLLLAIGLASSKENPYQSLLVVVALPVLFAIGLLLIPLGLHVDRRRPREGPKDALQAAFDAAFADRSARRRIIFVAVATLANVGLFAFVGQKAVQHMDSPGFCGTACHQPMQPEWEAFSRSPHSNVACVECHIGPGAAAVIKAKWNGVHQLLGVLTSSDNRRPSTVPRTSIGPVPGSSENSNACSVNALSTCAEVWSVAGVTAAVTPARLRAYYGARIEHDPVAPAVRQQTEHVRFYRVLRSVLPDDQGRIVRRTLIGELTP